MLPDFMSGWPFWVVFVFLYVGATVRGQATYWAGRIVTEQTLRRTHPTSGWKFRVHQWLQGGGADRGVNALRRWGLIVVPISYLTIGFQTMVLAGAGVLRITWPRFSVAQVPGALAWATIYSTIGWAVWEAALAAAAGSPVGIAVMLGVLAVIAVVVVHRRVTRSAAEAAGAEGTVDTAQDRAARDRRS